MFIYMRDQLINFSLVQTIIKLDKKYSSRTSYRIDIYFTNDVNDDSELFFEYAVEAERDKAFNDLMKLIGTINPDNMVP